MGDLEGALIDSDFAMREKETNPKAYFRQGQVNFLQFSIMFFVFCIQHSLNFSNSQLLGTHGT